MSTHKHTQVMHTKHVAVSRLLDTTSSYLSVRDLMHLFEYRCSRMSITAVLRDRSRLFTFSSQMSRHLTAHPIISCVF